MPSIVRIIGEGHIDEPLYTSLGEQEHHRTGKGEAVEQCQVPKGGYKHPRPIHFIRNGILTYIFDAPASTEAHNKGDEQKSINDEVIYTEISHMQSGANRNIGVSDSWRNSFF